MSSPSSPEFSDFPSSPEDYPKLKKPNYFAARKFLKTNPADSSSPGPSESKGNDTSVQDDSKKENTALDKDPKEVNEANSSPPGNDAQDDSSQPICTTPKTSRVPLPRVLIPQLKRNSEGSKKSKRNFGYTLFTSKRCRRPNVCRMQAALESSDSSDSDD